MEYLRRVSQPTINLTLDNFWSNYDASQKVNGGGYPAATEATESRTQINMLNAVLEVLLFTRGLQLHLSLVETQHGRCLSSKKQL